ncbi:hypothetical protein BDN70DRAFT_890397 [Pholiota conissans]|uniref:Fungal-type protein kinase domain-containing protein n=1 Tax=Pholiota conissans TaxID=109636 RepID=A0A9P5ZBN8_9AGAR|nr:hypothetical protein BDN70DRAFT_890397 [Pholiota conissans]
MPPQRPACKHMPGVPRGIVRITNFDTKRELVSALIDIIQAHHDLIQCGIQPKEIVLNNLVFLPENEGSSQGIYDAPTRMRKGYLVNAGHPPTDTLRFKALDLIKDPNQPRQAHHDLESFLYIIIYICVICAGPHNHWRTDMDTSTTAIAHWGLTQMAVRYLWMTKSDTMMKRELFQPEVLDTFAPYFKDFEPLVGRLRLCFFDQTRRGKVTHAEFIAVLQQFLRELKE